MSLNLEKNLKLNRMNKNKYKLDLNQMNIVFHKLDFDKDERIDLKDLNNFNENYNIQNLIYIFHNLNEKAIDLSDFINMYKQQIQISEANIIHYENKLYKFTKEDNKRSNIYNNSIIKQKLRAGKVDKINKKIKNLKEILFNCVNNANDEKENINFLNLLFGIVSKTKENLDNSQLNESLVNN